MRRARNPMWACSPMWARSPMMCAPPSAAPPVARWQRQARAQRLHSTPLVVRGVPPTKCAQYQPFQKNHSQRGARDGLVVRRLLCRKEARRSGAPADAQRADGEGERSGVRALAAGGAWEGWQTRWPPAPGGAQRSARRSTSH